MTQDEGGFTLIEVLIAIAIIGLAVTAIIGGLGVAARSSTANKSSSDSRDVLTATAEAIENAGYTGCLVAPPTGYPADIYHNERAGVAAPATGSDLATPPTVLNFSVWDGAHFSSPSGAACAYDQDTFSNSRMQRITLTQGSDTLTFVKRAP